MRTAASRPGRVGRRWREVSARVYREETTCWLCGEWVDQTLSSKHRMSRAADHLVQLCHGGRPTDRGNLALTHLACNSARSNKLRSLTSDRCACSLGLACAALQHGGRRGYVALDLRDL